jgi:hypothetical protein
MDNGLRFRYPFIMQSFLAGFERQFQSLHSRSCEIIQKIPSEKLFWQPLEKDSLFPINSCGEYILRSAGKVEQTFGGITTKLWDDPFEWTLPEKLSTNQLILEYLNEVEATRKKGFTFFQSDQDLKKELPAPVRIVSLFELLLGTLCMAENYQGRAIAIFRLITEAKIGL